MSEIIFLDKVLKENDGPTPAEVALMLRNAGVEVSDKIKGIADKTASLYWQVGFDTDIGGGRENQDDFFVWQKREYGVTIACVLDGHGREVGKVAAVAARLALLKYCEETLQELLESPYKWLVNAHEIAHREIKAAFRKELEGQGFEVQEVIPEGYLLKRKLSQAWSCVHGGSTCSIVATIGFDMYIANVGDSSATLCTKLPVLRKSQLIHLGDAACDDRIVPFDGTKEDDIPANTLELTANHSPESPSEFLRLRAFRHRDGDPTQPLLMVVYDSPSCEKCRCNPVFELNAEGVPCVTNKGRYYKNVRKEWASLVSTPGSARFQDALAMTRSLGDLHIESYGVIHLPEVQHIDLRKIFENLALEKSLSSSCSETANVQENSSTAAEAVDSSAETASAFPVVCLVLSTDGVWDNWSYEDVNKFVMDPSCLGAIAASADGAQRVAVSFMQRNAVYAKRNFGGQADNATGIVLYLSTSPSFPCGADVCKGGVGV